MSKISNLTQVSSLLNGDVSSTTPTVTTGLTVTGVDVAKQVVTVQSSANADLLVNLRGVTGVAVGSVVAVDLSTGDLSVLTAAAAPVQPAKAPASRGCSDRSFVNY